MNKKMFFGLLMACLLLALGAGQAYAGPSPTDGNSQSTGGQPQVFQTALFALGEVDLSTLGVSPTELLNVGPLLNPTLSNNGMLIVDDNLLDCPNAQYTSIQAAVTAANSGDTIKVCPGIYMEQVTIPTGKDGLTLFSEGAFQAIIKAPLVMNDPKAIVDVSGAHNVTIRHFTITGPGSGGCDSIRYGVRVDNQGSALITDNHITEIHDTPFSGCQNGIGVDVGRAFDAGVGTGTVVHNLIDRYQKGGVVVSNTGSSAEVAYNEVVGMGRISVIAQNGIQVSSDAYGDVHHNKVSQNYYTGEENEATGILLFSNPIARAHHNDVFLNESGVTTYFANQNSELSHNDSRNNDYGIVAYNPTINALISYNKAYENTLLDCRDDNAPASNRWVKDLGRTENQPGLCKQAGPQ